MDLGPHPRKKNDGAIEMVVTAFVLVVLLLVCLVLFEVNMAHGDGEWASKRYYCSVKH